MPEIYLYAEVLTHLRQLTLHASLQNEKNEETRIDVSSDKKIITVIHEGESSSLYLPTQISGTAKVTFPTEKKTELSARVQIDDFEKWRETEAAGIEAPWNASELSSETAMTCTSCDANILSSGTISVWKDLPNQNWAEVMDLWFCHKPHEHEDDENQTEAARAKGFSAQSKLASETGIGLVDLVSFALHPSDCSVTEIIKPDNENTFKPASVRCSQCHVPIGVFSVHDNLVRLDKASVKVKSRDSETFLSYSPTTFVAAQLLELIESTAVRKVIVYSQPSEDESPTLSELERNTTALDTAEHQTQDTAKPIKSPRVSSPRSVAAAAEDEPSNSSTLHNPTPTNKHSTPEPNTSLPTPPPLLLWIFNPDIYYSSSNLTTSTSTTLLPHRALKILYHPLSTSTLKTHLETSTPTHELLPLSTPTLQSLHETLTTSTALLPANARQLNEWTVGLLDRYERHSTAERVMAMNPLARELKGQGGVMTDGRPRVTRWEVALPVGAEGLFE